MNSITAINSLMARITAMLTGLLLAAATTPALASEGKPGNTLVFDDLDTFAAALAEIDAGSEPLVALQRYIDAASPGMQIFTERFGASAETIAARLASHPNYYRYLSTLRPELEAQESELLSAIGKLQSEAPAGSRPVPIYFLIANMRVGGNPGVVQTPEGPRPAIGIAIELMAMSDRVDLAEFPQRPPGVQLADFKKVALHEMAHIFQMQAQGLDNYRSLYADPARMTNLAFAVREGCADFLIWRAASWRLEDRHQFVTENADQLWAEFSPLLQQPLDPKASWFGPRNDIHPGRPMQVGYGIGEHICETFYDAANDKAKALEQIYGAYLAEHFEAILAPYAARMNR